MVMFCALGNGVGGWVDGVCVVASVGLNVTSFSGSDLFDVG